MGRVFTRNVSVCYSMRTAQGTASVPLLKVPMFIGYYTDRGKRPYQEDKVSASILTLPRLDREKPSEVFNFNIFDGHGGDQSAIWLQENLSKYVESANMDSGRLIAERYKQQLGGYWRMWRANLPRLERKLQKSVHDDLLARLPLAFLEADLEMCNEGPGKESGSTATSVFIYSLNDRPYWEGAPSILTVAQVGDTRALIADNKGNVLPLTTVHHASNPHETDRLGRFQHLFVQEASGVTRFLQYSNTRAFGDLKVKSMGVSAEPDVSTYLLGQNKGRLPGKEAFIVLVTDGVTDKASDQEIADLVIQSSQNWGSKGTPEKSATDVVRYVSDVGTEDNATAMVIRLAGWGKWDGWTDRSGKVRAENLMFGRRET